MIHSRIYAPGAIPHAMQPGDLLFVHRKAFYSRLVGFGQRLRKDRTYAHWTHVACVADTQGTLVEALGGPGIIKSNIEKYRHVDFIYVESMAYVSDKEQMARFLEAAVGRKYGWLDILSLGITLATNNSKFAFGDPGTLVCSTLAAQMLCRGDFIFDEDPANLMPADLAEFLKV